MKKAVCVLAVIVLASGEALAAVSALGGVLSFDVPAGWEYKEDQSERWMGDDPTCVLEKRSRTDISVTHYGLEGSDFPSPEAFEEHINGLFYGDDKKTGDAEMSGKAAKIITLRYTRGGYEDADMGRVEEEDVYDEFVILPLVKGYLVFNLTIYRRAWEGDFDGYVASTIKEWQEFLASCRINA